MKPKWRRGGERHEGDVGQQFVFDRGEEALGYRVIPAIPLATHARYRTVLGEECAVRAARVLTSAVRVVHEPQGGRRSARAPRRALSSGGRAEAGRGK